MRDRLVEAMFPRLWRAVRPDGTVVEVTLRGSDTLGPVPGMRVIRVQRRSFSYWRWWLTSNRFSLIDVVAILLLVRFFSQIAW